MRKVFVALHDLQYRLWPQAQYAKPSAVPGSSAPQITTEIITTLHLPFTLPKACWLCKITKWLQICCLYFTIYTYSILTVLTLEPWRSPLLIHVLFMLLHPALQFMVRFSSFYFFVIISCFVWYILISCLTSDHLTLCDFHLISFNFSSFFFPFLLYSDFVLPLVLVSEGKWRYLSALVNTQCFKRAVCWVKEVFSRCTVTLIWKFESCEPL